jgi:hypothetical protein
MFENEHSTSSYQFSSANDKLLFINNPRTKSRQHSQELHGKFTWQPEFQKSFRRVCGSPVTFDRVVKDP